MTTTTDEPTPEDFAVDIGTFVLYTTETAAKYHRSPVCALGPDWYDDPALSIYGGHHQFDGVSLHRVRDLSLTEADLCHTCVDEYTIGRITGAI